jgi:chromate transporter
MSDESERRMSEKVSLGTIGRQWLRLGCIGFGGPPTHITLLRQLCVDDRRWMSGTEFEDAVAATNLLPGPASTQLAIYCAWVVRGSFGALLGGVCFIVPGLTLILLLSTVLLASHPPLWILDAAVGAGAVVPAVALAAASSLFPTSWSRIGTTRAERGRWLAYAGLGCAAAVAIGPFLVLVLIACGVTEIVIRREARPPRRPSAHIVLPAIIVHAVAIGGFGALVWVAFKVGALSYGGGFVIVPLMQHDAVTTYHWMTGTQFLDAVALGQVTPGPVVQTVAVVGYAEGGIAGGLLAAFVAFAPSFGFVLFGARHFDAIKANGPIRSFLIGAGPAVIGAIAGSAVLLALLFQHWWQLPILAGGLLWIFALRRGVVSLLLSAGVVGVFIALLHH